MARTLLVHEDQAFTNKEALFDVTGAAPEEAGQFIYNGEVPKYLFRVYGPGAGLITDSWERAFSEVHMWGAGYGFTEISPFWS